ncbi:hypothetical protein BN1195_00326 [Chryseobacterium oranimense G311]|uniref:hypothetical protein n=1 Tax=Chryseobacterium oranimense TaxID=421058 RepID=UPI000533ADF4|nr:hypothetical protein [Chryseobacterium oranimense]CEJ68044.1 hypothetical protein BN1195_00326 [Chryseobacterium oranimense G311]
MKLHNILFLCISIIFFTSCKSDHSYPVKEVFSDKSYRKWLKDTLSILKQRDDTKNNRSYSINQDSSSLIIKTKIDTFIDNKSDIDNSRELKYAVSLLQRNHIMPKKKFRLISVTQCYYDLPYGNMGLLYDFQIDVIGFYIITDESKEEYRFMKGNLTDSISISTLPDIQKL